MSQVKINLRTIKPCSKCDNWSDCDGHPYYEITDIHSYCRHQVIWIIDRFLDYIDGHLVTSRLTWPDEFEATGYTDAERTGGQVRACAGYETVLQVVSPVSERLAKTDGDGEVLWALIRAEVPVRDFGSRARNALNYCAGSWGKRMEYQDWLTQRGKRQRKMNAYSVQNTKISTA